MKHTHNIVPGAVSNDFGNDFGGLDDDDDDGKGCVVKELFSYFRFHAMLYLARSVDR